MNLNFISETQALSIVIIVFIFFIFVMPTRNFARNKFYHMKDPDRIDLLGNRHFGYTSTPWKRYVRWMLR